MATLVLIGANQALVPVFATWAVQQGRQDADRMASGVAGAALGLGALVALAVAVGSGVLVRVLAPGLAPETSAVAAQVLRIMALTVPFTLLAEVLRAFLNARRAFVAPALVNAALNLTVIVVLVLRQDLGVLAIAWGYVAGNVLRTLILVVLAVRRGLAVNPLPALSEREVWSAVASCRRPLAGAGLVPLVRLIEQALASLLPSGSISLLNYGYRLVSGVGGAIFFRSLIVALVPRLTEAVSRGSIGLAQALTSLGVRLMVLVSLPLAGVVAVLGVPAVRLLFDRGRFDASSAVTLGVLLSLLALSLPPDGISRAQQAPYFSRRDTRTPFHNSVFGMAVNLVLLPLALLPSDRTSALVLVVLAYVVSRWATVVHAQRRLDRYGFSGATGVVALLRLLAPPLALSLLLMLALGVTMDLYELSSSVRLAGLLALTGAVGLLALLLPLFLQRRRLRPLLATPREHPVASHEPLREGQVA